MRTDRHPTTPDARSRALSARALSSAALLVAIGWLAPPRAEAAATWNEVTAPSVQTTNCITQATEPLGNASVAWFGDPNVPPQVNTVVYARIRWFVTGDPCI